MNLLESIVTIKKLEQPGILKFSSKKKTLNKKL